MPHVARSAVARPPRLDADRLVHPIKRLFGESRGVTWSAIFIVALVGMMLVRPLAASFFSYHRTAGLLAERRTEVAQLRARHSALQRQLAYYRTPQFVAERARTFGMIAPGEKPYIMRELVHPSAAAQFAISRLRNATVDHPIALDATS